MKRAERTIEAVAVVAFVLAIVGHGVPALRHDWYWPTNPEMRASFFSGYTSGWDVTGFGQPNARPGMYLLALPLWLLMQVLSPAVVLAIFSGVIAWVTFRGTRLLAQALSAPSMACTALGICALFNPWVYTEVVAGHLAAVLAFGLSLEIAALAYTGSDDAVGIGLRLGVVMMQLQLFIVDVAGLLILFGNRRAMWRAVGIGSLFALPDIIGILGDRRFLSALPYTLDWQKVQSLPEKDAVALLGYSANYTRFSDAWFRYGMDLLALMAVAGSVLKVRSRRAAVVTLMGVLAFVAITGSRGPAGAAYDFIVLHAQWSGVFRELYTIACYLVMIYIVFAAAACARVPSLSYAIACAAALCCAGWIAYAPFRWFVPGSEVPVVQIDAPPQTRFALLPAVQPMTFDGRGSGVDPDMYARSGDVTPLNAYLASYPAIAAFQLYRLRGNDSWLPALSVSVLRSRPWLQTDVGSLRGQLDVGSANARRHSDTTRFAAAPELALSDEPAIGSLDRLPDRSGVFFGDVPPKSALAHGRRLPRFIPVVPDRAHVDPGAGWVDARLLFYAYPQIAQGLGGVGTTGSALLQLTSQGPLLAAVAAGELQDEQGRTLLREEQGFRWIRLQSAPRDVRCRGVCVVVGQASSEVGGLPLDPNAQQRTSVPFAMPLPWIVTAVLPPGREQLLRFNAAYDENWMAWTEGMIPAHLRIDTIANGWILPERDASARVTIVHVTAAVQAILELVLVTLALALLAMRLRTLLAR